MQTTGKYCKNEKGRGYLAPTRSQSRKTDIPPDRPNSRDTIRDQCTVVRALRIARALPTYTSCAQDSVDTSCTCLHQRVARENSIPAFYSAMIS